MKASDLFARHAEGHLARYRGNVRALLDAVESGFVPDLDEPGLRAHVDALERHLAAAGDSPIDTLLLRFGILVPGRQRGIVPPVAVLSPERGGFSQPRLEQAAGQVRRLREALHLARACFPDTPEDTLSAFRSLDRRQRASLSREDSWVDVHTDLPEDDVRDLRQRAFTCLDSASPLLRELGIDVLRCLANFRWRGLGDGTRELLKRGVFYPPSLHRDAPDDVADEIASSIPETRGRLDLDHRLLALAWTRGEVAWRAFARWSLEKPVWTGRLAVPVGEYLHDAGWAIEANGQRRDLMSTACHRLVPLNATAVTADPIVRCRVAAGATCPSCTGELYWLFDFSEVPAGAFPKEDGSPRRVLACLDCMCFTTVFSRYAPDGSATWHQATERVEDVPRGEAPAPTLRTLRLSPGPPFAVASLFALEDASCLGGIPMWVQDAEHPRCPDCQVPMVFLAQLDHGSLRPPEEGVSYSFFCGGCQVAAVSYQQT